MKNLNSKIFFCYAWEDLNEVNSIVADIQHELGTEVSILQYDESVDLEETLYPNIDNADLILVFVSETSKNSEVVKQCISYCNNLNKKIIPVELKKSNLFSSVPDEFKFRTKPIDYKDEEQRAKFFSQLKANCGINVESGDNYGCLIHISIDVDATVYRYGADLCHATAGTDNTIRLSKGTHKLDFIADSDPNVRYSLSYAVHNNDGEQFVDVPLSIRIKEIKERKEREAREAKQREEFEKEQLQNNLRLKQREKELEILEREQAIKQAQQQQYYGYQQQPSQNNDNSGVKAFFVVIIIVGIILIWIIGSLISFISSL